VGASYEIGRRSFHGRCRLNSASARPATPARRQRWCASRAGVWRGRVFRGHFGARVSRDAAVAGWRDVTAPRASSAGRASEQQE
jgi:hypothetical protein